MKRKIVQLLLILILPCAVFAQWLPDTIAIAKVNIYNEANINTDHLEFCPILYKDNILIVRSNEDGDKDDLMDDYYLDLAYAAKNAKGHLSKQAYLPFSVNSNKHEGQAAYDATNGKLYFTRSYYDEERGTNKDTIVLKIYEARESANYANPKALSFCNDKFSVCHPTLFRNGDKLIFSSNMPGSSGMDLYISEQTSAIWSEPKSLGFQVNSIANEVFPYLYNDSLLFFSSNRIGGAGGLDIYYTTYADSGWAQPRLLPYPINSSFDDIGFLIQQGLKTGYMSSNRPGGKGKDDIYRFESVVPLLKRKVPETDVRCQLLVIDKLSFLPLNGATVIIDAIDINTNLENAGQLELVSGRQKGEIVMKMVPKVNKSDTLESDENGIIQVTLKRSSNHLIHANITGYQQELLLYNPGIHGADFTIVVNPVEDVIPAAEEIPSKPGLPTEIGSLIIFNNIYYAYNSTSIAPEAAEDLDQLITAMTNNPTMRIQLSSHTDARGNALYNKQLSELRAASAKAYVVSKGIDGDRIITLGFGETRIRNHCLDGVQCSEEEHLYNRRTEVLVIE
ncbi:MAG: OmpA family protein [Saprospiraceae bacterium]|nr:OmpA family protein [Saprospiraceae bacterium]